MKWDLNKIQSYIDNQVEESLHLDYKASQSLSKNDKKKGEISKDVSAMANSDGGIIVYGISEYQERSESYLPEKLDPIIRSDFSKEWLEQVINSNISPRIGNIQIFSISTNKKDEVIYVVDIPKSNTAHQAKDKCYYKRYNFESIKMEDYEIKDIINRVKNPVIDLEFKILQEINSPFDTWIEVKAKNSSSILANYMHCFIDIPFSLLEGFEHDIQEILSIDGIDYVTFELGNKKRDIVGYNHTGRFSIPKYGSSYYIPLLPSISYDIGKINIASNYEITFDPIIWRTISDNSTNSGFVDFGDLDFSIKN